MNYRHTEDTQTPPHSLSDFIAEADDTSLEFKTRAIDLYSYANDASHFSLTPEVVAVAQNAQDIARILPQAQRFSRPVTFRSGGTSLSGQAVSDSVLIDVRKGFRGVEILDDGLRVRVEPGTTVRHINTRLLRYRRKLGPDPASEIACTIGGIISNNSSGMSCGTEFNTYSTLDSMTFILPSGTLINTADTDADDQLKAQEPALHQQLITLRDRIRNNPASVKTITQQFSMKNTMGYGLNSFLDYNIPVEILEHLIIGSEGTLAFIAEAVFNTVPIYPHTATGFLVFDNIYEANNSLTDLTATGTKAVELLDNLSLRVGQESPYSPESLTNIRLEDQAALLIEYQAETAEELTAVIDNAAGVLERFNTPDTVPLTQDVSKQAELWHLRKGLYAAVAGARPTGTTALLEDIVVPVPDLAQVCSDLAVLFDRYEYENSVIFGHAKDGNIHFMLTDHFTEGPKLDRYQAFTEDMVELVLGASGSLKAEHGTGRVMAPYVKRQYGEELYDIMREIKHACDPHNILNPGVIINEDETIHLQHIKHAPSIEEEADRCVECGYCEPVCPSKDLTLTPRQRIVIQRAINQAKIDGDSALVKELEKESQYDSVDTCAVDGMCQTACPVNINTGDLVRRLRHEGGNPVHRTVWASFASSWGPIVKGFSALLSTAKVVPGPLITPVNKAARTVLGKEHIPLWSKDLPRGGKSRKVPNLPASPDIQYLYFPSCMGTMFGNNSGTLSTQESVTLLAQAANIHIGIPPSINGLCCGTPWSSKGVNTGYDTMKKNVITELLKYTDNGRIPIISDAASCTEGLINMVQDESSQFTFVDSLEFITTVVLKNLPPVEKIPKIAVHPTCSSTRIDINDHLQEIAHVLAEDVFIPPSWGCCGFAGDRGMLHPELTESATHVQAQEVKDFDADLHVSCNRACELGMSRATGKDYQHMIQALAHAVMATTGA